MGLFTGINDAEVTAGGRYFAPGNYRVKIKGVKVIESRRSKKDLFIIECEVLESTNDKYKPGSTASQVIVMNEIMSLPNVKGFMCAASGVDPEDDDANDKVGKQWTELTGKKMSFEDACEYAISPDQPLAGTELELECVEIITKGKGQPFTKHVWNAPE